MAEHYTDEDVLNVRDAIDAWNDDHRDDRPLSVAVLDAVAPAIAARALREAAARYDDFQRPMSGLVPKEWADGFMAALDGAVSDLRKRADEIEAS